MVSSGLGPVPLDPDAIDLDDAVIIALGCNDKGVWGSRQDALEAALARCRPYGIDVMARSSWWASRAWPDAAHPPFLNGVIIVRTALDPLALMGALGRIEQAFGRRRSTLNAPRTLDLDLIAYGREAGDRDGLILPHPRAADRLFVMGPLAEIAPQWVHPTLIQTSAALIPACSVGLDARAI